MQLDLLEILPVGLSKVRHDENLGRDILWPNIVYYSLIQQSGNSLIEIERCCEEAVFG